MQRAAVAKDDPKLYGAGILDGAAAVARAHWLHMGIRLFALLALAGLVAHRIKKQGGQMVRSPMAWLSALFAGVGLMPFLPMLRLGAHLGRFRTAAELAMRPFGEWD